MSRFLRGLPCLLTLCSWSLGCGDNGGGAADAGGDAAAEAEGGDGATDHGGDRVVEDAAAPDEETGGESTTEVDEPDEAGSGEGGAEDVGAEVPPGDAGGEVCDPASVGWDTPLVLSPAEFHALLEERDRILINVFDDVIPQIPGTDAQLPWTDVPAIEEYLRHDLCADLAIYCRRGVRSAGVAETLVAHGYRFVRVLEGGIEAWQAAGYPVE